MTLMRKHISFRCELGLLLVLQYSRLQSCSQLHHSSLTALGEAWSIEEQGVISMHSAASRNQVLWLAFFHVLWLAFFHVL